MNKKKSIEGITLLLALIVFIPLGFVWFCALIWSVLVPWMIVLFSLDFTSNGGWYELLKMVISWFIALGISWVGLVLIEPE